MQHRLRQGLAALFVTFALITVANAGSEKACGAGEAKEKAKAQKIALADLPAAVRAAIDKEIPGATIDQIEKETADGKVVYDVEAKLNGKRVEMDLAGDGKVLTRQDEVPFASLPAAARAAAEKYFGGPGDYQAGKEVENGKVSYEVEGKRDGAKAALKISEDGKRVTEEKE
jgi:uncharacterized membrane protein YkoI